jgi:ATP-binding cassette, subfamily B, bacterial
VSINKISSRKQYKEFIKENGIFTLKRKRKEHTEKSLSEIIGRLFREFKEYRRKLVMVMVLGFSTNIVAAAFPWGSKYMIDTVFPQNSKTLLLAACGLLLLIGILDVCLRYIQDYTTNAISGSFSVQVKNKLMNHLQKMPLFKIQELKVGGIISRLQQDTEAMSGLLFEAIVSPFNAIVMLVVAMISLFVINWKVALVCVVFSCCLAFIAYFVFNIMRPFRKDLREDNSLISAKVAEVFNGAQVVRSFCKENTIRKDYGIGVGLLWRKTLYANTVGISVHRTVWLIYYLMQVSIWLFGGYNVMNGNMTVGGVVVFISFIPYIFNPIFNIMSLFAQLQKSMACAERAFDLLDEDPEMIDAADAFHVGGINEGIELHDVTFAYPDGTIAIEHASIQIPKGKVTALVGPSGGGKTTLTNLIMRFYDVTKGKITVDGMDIQDIKINSYRKMMSLVLQDVFLFDGTAKENISFGKMDASDSEIIRAAKVAHCHEFIDKLDAKYDTILGERGVKLSGGQRQRIALARAILTNPKLLILDEATSNLDSESEGLIQEALRDIFKNRTTIVIAHRLSTILDADNIIVIENGNIAEQGTHKELLDRKGRYAEMYKKQMEKGKIVQNYWTTQSTDEQQNQ